MILNRISMDITGRSQEKSTMCLFSAKEEEGEFHTMDVCKVAGKKCSNILKWVYPLSNKA
jgi:hypothetical protein